MCRTPRSRATRAVWEKILEGTRDLSGAWLVRLALFSIGVLGTHGAVWRQGAALLIPLGHVRRRRPSVLGVPVRPSLPDPLRDSDRRRVGAADWAGDGAGARAAPIAAIIIGPDRDATRHPFEADLPMCERRDRPRECRRPSGRDRVPAARLSRGDDLRQHGLARALHAGALRRSGSVSATSSTREIIRCGTWPSPRRRPFAGWMLVEEFAEGGDVLAQRIRADPRFTDGYDRVCEGGNVALYQAEGPVTRRTRRRHELSPRSARLA